MLNKRALLPLACTLANGICGFAAVTIAARVPRGMDYYDAAVITWLWLSGWFIIAAMLFDGIDGGLARLTRSASDFGGELDSLCDAISFGVAPGFLLLKLSEPDAFPVPVLWAIAVFYLSCVAIRLAIFNVQNSPDDGAHRMFRGLPSPAAAGVIAGVALVRHQIRTPTSFLGRLIEVLELEVAHVEHLIAIVMPLLAIVLGVLMISRIPYPHATATLFSRSTPRWIRIAVGLLLVPAVLGLREALIPLLFASYAFVLPVLTLGISIKRRLATGQAGSSTY